MRVDDASQQQGNATGGGSPVEPSAPVVPELYHDSNLMKNKDELDLTRQTPNFMTPMALTPPASFPSELAVRLIPHYHT